MDHPLGNNLAVTVCGCWSSFRLVLNKGKYFYTDIDETKLSIIWVLKSRKRQITLVRDHSRPKPSRGNYMRIHHFIAYPTTEKLWRPNYSFSLMYLYSNKYRTIPPSLSLSPARVSQASPVMNPLQKLII